MSFFSKIFGTKDAAATTADRGAGAPRGGDFIAALALQLRGETEAALGAYREIAAEIPDGTLAPFFAAAVRAGQGGTAEAAESLRSLSRQAAGAGEALSGAIAVQLAALLGNDPYAVRTPAVAEVIASFGDLLKKEGFLQESAVCFEVAAGLVPDNAHVLHKLGDTLHDLRVYDYAEAVLLEALRCAPNHWGALYTYAVLLQDLGRDEEAIGYYGKVVRLNPNHANSQNNYGAALLRSNRLEEALAHCTRAAALDPGSPFVKINLGNIHRLMQDYQAARTCFAEAISLDGNLGLAYYGLGSVEQALKSDPGQVRELYRKAIEVNPAMPEVHHALGNLLAKEGDPEALAHFFAAARLNDALRNLQRDYGAFCLQLGRREEALEHLGAALRQDPDDAPAREMLARVAAESPA